MSLQGSAQSKERWKETVKDAARKRCQESVEWYFLDNRPLAVTIYYFPVAPMVGDVDNIVKLILDALKNVAYPDDRYVERVTVQKFEPGLDWDFANPSDQLLAALEAGPPVVYVRIDDDLNWRTV